MPPESTHNSFIKKALEFLRARSPVGGLEISDAALRFASEERGSWKLAAVRLPPGVIQGGVVRRFPDFVQALQSLHEQILGAKSRTRLSVAVSLSSVNIYSQVFVLPVISGEGLATAVRLNMEMISPADMSQFYAGWQVLNESADGSPNIESLGAFINRQVIDDMQRALQEARFLPVVVESKALALTRLMRTWGAGFDPRKSYVVLLVDPVGIDFLVIRNSALYFEYLTFWKDIQGDERTLAPDVFRATLIQNLRRVLNFYSQHWNEPLAELFLATPDLKDDISKIITENFSLTLRELTLRGAGTIPPAWFVALGSGLRGALPRREDQELSLLGIDAQGEFAREELTRFLHFWRLLAPLAFSVLLITFVFTDLVLASMARTTRTALQERSGTRQLAELGTFERQAADFNATVGLILNIQKSLQAKNEILTNIQSIAAGSGVAIYRVALTSGERRVTFAGRAPSEDVISRFKQGIEAFRTGPGREPFFSDVQVPLSAIKREGQDVSFSMSFVVASLASGKTP